MKAAEQKGRGVVGEHVEGEAWEAALTHLEPPQFWFRGPFMLGPQCGSAIGDSG